MADIAIAGAGKLGCNVGADMLRLGHRVTWLVKDEAHLDEMLPRAARLARRATRLLPAGAVAVADVRLVAAGPPTDTDVLIECVTEDLEAKRAVFDLAAAALDGDALLATCSSSILPSSIHPRCVGMHFFYPVELTRVVEIVAGPVPALAARAARFAASCDLAVVMEDERSAFAANRLLLPVQNELFHALAHGADPALLDTVPRLGMLPRGQLALMDTIGLDVICAAVKNYVGRMAQGEAVLFRPLTDGLSRLVEAGKRGAKNGDGILVGGPLPFAKSAFSPRDLEAFGMRLRALFANTCLSLAAELALSLEEMDLLTRCALQMETSLGAELTAPDAEAFARTLERALEETGRRYFAPAPRLTSLARDARLHQ